MISRLLLFQQKKKVKEKCVLKKYGEKKKESNLILNETNGKFCCSRMSASSEFITTDNAVNVTGDGRCA